MNRHVVSVLALLCALALLCGCAPKGDTTSATTTTTSSATQSTTTKGSPSSTKRITTKTQKSSVTRTTETKQTYKTREKTTTCTTTADAKPSESDTTDLTTVTVEAPTTTKQEPTTVPQATTSSSRRTVSTKSRTSATTPTTVNDPDNPFAIFYPITPSLSIQESSKRIRNDATPKRKLPSDVATITTFDPNWAFAHHPGGFEYFKGKFYAAFSRGYTGEDMPGQQAVLCTSDDFYHWSEPQVIAPATQGAYGETCVGPGPMYVAGGKLFYTYGVSDYSKEYFSGGTFNPRAKGTRTDTMYRIYTEDGVNWSKPQRISSIGMNYYLRQNLTGRWMSCYGSWLHRSDADVPDGVTWDYYVMPNEMRQNSQKRNGGTLHESSWYQSLDGVVHIMIRSDKGYLWNAESYDNGETFTEFYPTKFSSKNTQFNFYNLPDGRAVAVGSPASSTSVWDMWPLNLYISNDGYNFNTAYTLRNERYAMKQEGYSKGGEYAYMKFLVHEDYFYVFYSKMKEVMEVTRVKISDLIS